MGRGDTSPCTFTTEKICKFSRVVLGFLFEWLTTWPLHWSYFFFNSDHFYSFFSIWRILHTIHFLFERPHFDKCTRAGYAVFQWARWCTPVHTSAGNRVPMGQCTAPDLHRAPARSEPLRLIGWSRLYSGADLEWVESESGWVTQGYPGSGKWRKEKTNQLQWE